MDTSEVNSSRGYGKPPWIFKGSALYQLHLVKAETARAFIPKELRLVEAFGYTLGGFFLANYEESPAGIFDELVVIAGIVWNPPTSCAWAARVLVNSDKACLHGQKDVGLPSRVANFTKSVRALPVSKRSRFGGFMNKIGISDSMEKCLDIQVEEMNNHIAMDLCSIKLTSAASQKDTGRWMGPEIKMSLPSFSGRTEHNPHLLKYSCQIGCRVRAVSPAKVCGPFGSNMDGEGMDGDSGNEKRDLSISVMLSKPILALEFNCLEMKVEAPTIVPQEKHG
ncbi:protein NEOXANTHIN-DEFICIENT 1-like isoform X1 [Salvia splendens]|uniref:protein NEOXANTHIN-DEFICIENT 1-like isoform X1 n=1 Tax=Salvia splendens TaxID=180675 RepID=UPI001C2616E8|nr:protein NEOXANTHIN-DEFICIENT 1-like isoform X1 [Salvia splendens]